MRQESSKPAQRTLAHLFGWIGEHVRGFYGAIGAFLTLGLVATVATLFLFAGTAEMIEEGTTESLDGSLLLWLNTFATPRLDGLALEVTALGSGLVTLVITCVASLILWHTRHRYSAALLWIALIGGIALNVVLKSIFNRARPDLFEWRTPHAGQSSYPSGHSMGAMVVYATLMYLVSRLEPSRLIRVLTVLLFSGIILSVGISRMYLGVHYPSDVLGGYLVGFAWASTCALGIEAVRYFRARRPQVRKEEGDLEHGLLDDTDREELGSEPAPASDGH